MSSLVGKDTQLDAVGRKFEPCLTAGSVCVLLAPLWCDLGSCSPTSPTVVAVEAAAKRGLLWKAFAADGRR